MSKVNYILFLLLAFSLQIVLSATFLLPIDFMLIVLIVYVIEKDAVSSIFMGVFIGLLQDTLSGGLFGIRAFSKTIVAYLLSKIGKKIIAENGFIQFTVAFIASYVDLFIVGELGNILKGTSYHLLNSESFTSALLNSLLCCFFFYIISRLRLRETK